MTRKSRAWLWWLAGLAALVWAVMRWRKASVAPQFEAGYPTASNATRHFPWHEIFGDNDQSDATTKMALGVARMLEVVRDRRGDLPMILHFGGTPAGKDYSFWTVSPLPGQAAGSLRADVVEFLDSIGAMPTDVDTSGGVYAIDNAIATQWGTATNG